jgi:hypothetical protein
LPPKHCSASSSGGGGGGNSISDGNISSSRSTVCGSSSLNDSSKNICNIVMSVRGSRNDVVVQHLALG